MGMDGVRSQLDSVYQYSLTFKVRCRSIHPLHAPDLRPVRHVAGGHQGLGRYATLLKALVESAVLSWLASLGSAMIWSISLAQYYSLPDDVRAGHNSVVVSHASISTLMSSTDAYISFARIALRY
jgi:hypothetical protein